jgi:SAM-dependent methyltransferase
LMPRVKRFLARTVPGLYGGMSLVKHRMLLGEAEGPQVFATIFRRNFWRGSYSRSGAGSDLVQTKIIRETLPRLLEELGVRSLLDLPCGDFYWMSKVDLNIDKYIGADIVEELIGINTRTFGSEKRTFIVSDVTNDALPTVDAIICRDCLVHLSFEDIQRAFSNINRSGAAYLLTTTFVGRAKNTNIRTGQWRPVNLAKPPFNLPIPLRVINEDCTEDDGAYADKSLGLWRLPV